MSILTEDLRESLLSILQEKAGTPFALNSISKRLGIGNPALRAVLMEMGPTHNVRQSQSGRHIAYLIPTPEMLRQEDAQRAKEALSTWHPLRRRGDHALAVQRAYASKLK
jgi:hypothetical protein